MSDGAISQVEIEFAVIEALTQEEPLVFVRDEELITDRVFNELLGRTSDLLLPEDSSQERILDAAKNLGHVLLVGFQAGIIHERKRLEVAELTRMAGTK